MESYISLLSERLVGRGEVLFLNPHDYSTKALAWFRHTNFEPETNAAMLRQGFMGSYLCPTPTSPETLYKLIYVRRDIPEGEILVGSHE